MDDQRAVSGSGSSRARSKPAVSQSRSPRKFGLFLLGLAACVAVVFWWSNEQPAPEPEHESRETQGEKARSGLQFSVARPSLKPPDQQPRSAAAVAASIQNEAVADHLHEPHPITKQHLENYRQVDLLHEAWVAIKRGDYALGRQIVGVHRAEYAGQWEDMNEGLEAVADCMQNPSPETIATARRFYEERTASLMRKRVRRYCLEQQ